MIHSLSTNDNSFYVDFLTLIVIYIQEHICIPAAKICIEIRQ